MKFLEKKALEKYPESGEIKSKIGRKKQEHYVQILKSFLEEEGFEDLREKMMDKENTRQQYDEAKYKIINENRKRDLIEPKPSVHFLAPLTYEKTMLKPIIGKNSEQDMIVNFIGEVNNTLINDDEVCSFIKYIFDNVDYCLKNEDKKQNTSMFNDGHYINAKNVGIEYSELKEENKKSYYSFLVEKDVFKMENPNSYIEKKKIIKINEKMSEKTQNYWLKAGISFLKHNENIELVDHKNESISFENKKDIDKVLITLREESGHEPREEYFDNYDTIDTDEIKYLKKESVETYMEPLSILKSTNSYLFSKNISLICKQLIHYQLFNLSQKSYCLFNCGIPNLLYIVAGCYNKLTVGNGKPFMCLLLTKKPDLYNTTFGKLFKYKLNNGYTLVVTNWRRLPVFKLTHIKDCYYSVLSSTMNSYLSSKSKKNYNLTYTKIIDIFTLRTLFSICTNQKLCEILMDTRYAYMSAFSTHTNIQKLLCDKFGPNYRTSIEVWVVNKLLEKLPIIFKEVVEGDNIKVRKPNFIDGKRKENTIGGDIKITSLWFSHKVRETQEIMDEAFIYVHTIKEPSNIYHEQVKALMTIKKFQDDFDSLSYKRKHGLITTKKELYDFFMDDNIIGCCNDVIYHSVRSNIQNENPFFKKIVDELNDEPISEIISTKAVIHDIDRKIEEDKITKIDEKKMIRRYEKITNTKPPEEILSRFKQYKFNSKSNYYSEMKPRQKVMETILDILIEKNLDKTIEVANDFVLNDNGDVLADICIKSQYGSKREFYVINIGAKALARVTENFFKKVCENSVNEAISIPGDKKLMEMQKMLDVAYNVKFNEKMKMKYVNGDCTKWSAAETMASFISMTEAFKEFIPEGMYTLLNFTFCTWANKKIQIPLDVLNKVIPITTNTEYLKMTECDSGLGRIKSTHNFLQGMFNYGSSYKAVCCANYTYNIFKTIYKKSELKMYHMEHSDDYVLIVLYKDDDDFKKFRILHKMMMKLHGYNDSTKKTSCQLFLLEFVSLMSFNGLMLYPQIKKSKEVNTSLPATGYKTDSDAAMSRVNECMRVGCNQSFLYFFQRLHNICLAEEYSLLPTMKNNFNRTFEELLNTPVELFGIPDTLPLFSIYCKGNINNYRLYKYGDINTKKIITLLFLLGNEILEIEEYMGENIELNQSLYHPRYFYETNKSKITNIRKKIDISIGDIKEFWEKHISYKFLKPKNKELLKNWIKCMFFNRNFTEAYTKVSRTQMNMRISRYINNKTLGIHVDYKDKDIKEKELYTMKETYEFMIKYIDGNFDKVNLRKHEKDVLKVVTKFDPTPSTIYSILQNMKFGSPKEDLNLPIATYTPMKITTYNLINSPSVIMQYLYNKDDFRLDNRHVVSEISLMKDIKTMEERIGKDVLNSNRTIDILSVYNDMYMTVNRRNVMIGYNRNTFTLEDSMKDILENNFYYNLSRKVLFTGMINVTDPRTNKQKYLKENIMTADYTRQSLDNICLLYVYMKIRMKMRTADIKKTLDKLRFKQKINNEITNVSYKNILNRYNPNYVAQHNIKLNEKKVSSYLKYVLMNERELCNDLCSSIYMYSSFYNITDTKIGGKYLGRTVCSFRYMNDYYKVVKEPELENIFIICNKLPGKKIIPVYNIGKRLCGMISEGQLEQELNVDNVHKEKNMIKINNNIMKEYNIFQYFDYSHDGIVSKKTNLTKEKRLPYFMTKDHLYFKQSRPNPIMKAFPEINEKNLTVRLGKYKLFTLPFWKCQQYDNVEILEEFNLDGLNIKYYLQDKFLKKFINGKTKSVNIEIDNYMDIEDDVFEFFEKNEIGIKMDVKFFLDNDNKNKKVHKDFIEYNDRIQKLTTNRNYDNTNIFEDDDDTDDDFDFLEMEVEEFEHDDDEFTEMTSLNNMFDYDVGLDFFVTRTKKAKLGFFVEKLRNSPSASLFLLDCVFFYKDEIYIETMNLFKIFKEMYEIFEKYKAKNDIKMKTIFLLYLYKFYSSTKFPESSSENNFNLYLTKNLDEYIMEITKDVYIEKNEINIQVLRNYNKKFSMKNNFLVVKKKISVETFFKENNVERENLMGFREEIYEEININLLIEDVDINELI